jgi:pimeloyl-ACP methyl ester carboxylesterase
MQARIEGFLSSEMQNYHLQHLHDCVSKEFADTPRGQWLIKMFSQRSHELSGACIANIFRARLSCDMTDRLAEIRAPAMVINGEHDMSMNAGLLTARLLPNAVHRVIPGAGHACNIEKPEIFDAFVREIHSRN